MASPSSSGRRGPRPIRKAAPPPLDHDRARLASELEELRLRELEVKKKQQEIQRKVEELPRQIEERERKQREMVRVRAIATATTADCFNKPWDKRYASGKKTSSSRRRTRPEERSARNQFLLLCVVLAAFLFLLCKSLPH